MTYQTVNPFNNQLIKTYPDATDDDLENALARGHDLYKTWRKQEGPGDRPAQLRQVAKLFRQDEDALATNMTRDMGKLVGEARAEVELCADIADYFADQAEELLAPVPLDNPAGKAYYVKQATGVLVMVEPWNFPYYQIMRVFAPNFILGNPMILKHASNVPSSAVAFEETVTKAGAPEGSLTNLFINYDQVDRAIADPRVSGVALTGSERGGASVAKSAGAHLKKSSMELGGNDAFIILDDADWNALKQVAPGARLMNAGQVCCASKRFIVMEDRYDDFVSLMVDAFSHMVLGDPNNPDTTLAPMCTVSARDNLAKQVDRAVAAGAKVACGSKPYDSPGAFFTPTILTDIDRDNPAYDQEMFGPVATIYKVASEDEAVDLANDSSYGLGGVIFSQDSDHADALASRIETGMTFINGSWVTMPELPFGGVKNSGYGRELYSLGFDTFANEHLIFQHNN
ncbi:NAD-dependent succinate-semialdehyde dehydrogenase [Bifidobacterium sp. B4001]|uniref:NAD-dependent succinate-semialdehyde dehydrogenase n=2 Tax=Bifidobacterium TaxID=1678 RepID=UPI001C69CE31|nr:MULTISPECIES: NAD-dependent succinate-semialdehyde dehydrogenase [Bifidobacterium]MCX8672335.1 NAD-dependent succinate-semialdehyde dehydrogenase [Bifidobacterium sp. B4079]MCX8680769.1 NAD-dependent succinate-semialdehyde dehydrogenase [Bifidobacterium sp. B4001]QYN60412.1 NAD-dependent succinate-semialdehyde dehydrogenase [Bifidobacterium asteroides]